MNTLERLREELREMEEANSRGELNQNELADLERLRAEITAADQAAIEDRRQQISEYDNSEIDRRFSENEWYRSHIDELNEMRASQNLSSFSEGDRADLQALESEFAQRRREVSEQYYNEKSDEIENLFKQDPWYQAHIDELNEMRASQNLSSFSEGDRADLQALESEFEKRRQEYVEKYNDNLISQERDNEKIETLTLDEDTLQPADDTELSNIERDGSQSTNAEEKVETSDNDSYSPKHMTPSDDELGYSEMTIKELMEERDRLRNTLFNTGINLPQFKDNLRHRIELIESTIREKMKERRNNELPSGPEIKGSLESGIYGELPPAKEETKDVSGIKGYLPGEVEKEKDQEPTPTPTPPEPDEEEIHVKRTLEQILSELMSGEEMLGLSNKDVSRFNASNIRVASSLKARINDGPLAYVLAKLPQIPGHTITAIAALGQKASGNLLSTEVSRKKIELFKKRLESLSKEDLETIYREYRGVKVIESKLPKFMNDLIAQRIRKYELTEKTSNEEINMKRSGMTVSEIEKELSSLYKQIYDKQKEIDSIDEELENEHITYETAKIRHNSAASGSVDIIKRIKELQTELSSRYVGTTGIHSFEEDMKAANSGMNLQGRRGAKENSEITKEMQEAWAESAEYDRELAEALAHGNDLDALESFVNHENAVSRQTVHKNSILWGNRSVGIREYTPVARELDYREDPLLRDLVSSTMQVTSMIALANGIATEIEKNKIAEAHNAEISRANNANRSVIDEVHQSGRQITDDSEAFGRGMAANTHQAKAAEILGHERQELDRAAIDSGGSWTTGMSRGFYDSAADAQNHAASTQALHDLSVQFEDARTQFENSLISPTEYVERVSSLSSSVQNLVTPEYNSILTTMQEYAQSSGLDFDLEGQMGELQYLVDHVQDITDMNGAMIDVTKIGEALQQVDLQTVPRLAKLPSNLLTQAVTCGMLFNASRRLSTNVELAKVGQPENDITRRVREDANQNEAGAIIEDAEERYHNMGKLKRAMSVIEWHKFRKLSEKEDLTSDEVEQIKGMFR